jgi:CubicO group peptidase (beta-lactamase class C family)
MIKLLFLTGLLLATLATTAQEKPLANDINFKIQTKIDSIFSQNVLPGIFVGVINNGKRLYYSKGFANTQTKLQFDSATLFEIGSITKTFTAYVLQKILTEKKIADTASILAYLPDSVQQNKALQQITFLSLMNHTSGLPRLPDNMPNIYGNKIPYDNYSLNNLFAYLKKCTPKPNGKSNYSNLGMGLAGVLAARIGEKSYGDLLDTDIFRPFKMIATTDTFSKSGNKSEGNFNDEATPYWSMDALAPAGCLKCTGKEMLNYLQYMAQPKNKAIDSIISDILRPTVALAPKINVCKAWHTFEEQGKPVVYWHNGGTYGFSTFTAFIKGQQNAVIIVINEFSKNKIADGLGISIMKLLNQ